MSTAIGVALGNRYDKIDNTTYLFVGDGECNEGTDLGRGDVCKAIQT